MDQLPTNCPSCNSLQRFPLKERVANGKIERYIQCLMCREIVVIEAVTREELKARRKRRTQLHRRMRAEKSRQ